MSLWDDFKDSKAARVGAGLLTGGASEAVIGAERLGADDAVKYLARKAEEGAQAFASATLKELRNLKPDSFADVLNLAKIVATGGASWGVNKVEDAFYDMINKWLSPYVQKLGEAMGSAYADGKDATVRAAERIFDKVENKGFRETLQLIARNIAREGYDIVFGYPPCMCEPGCIGPVADALAKNGNPYIKLVGQILKVMYPAIQGTVQGAPKFAHSAPALAMYAGNKDKAGIRLLPQGKLDNKALTALKRILDAVGQGKNFMAGMPKSYGHYKIYLVDHVARGFRGPTVLATDGRDARYYFEHPDKALEVIKKADKIGDITSAVSKYLEYVAIAEELISSVQGYKSKSFDLFEAVKNSDFNFDPKLVKEYVEKGVGAGKDELERRLADADRAVDKFRAQGRSMLTTRAGRGSTASDIIRGLKAYDRLKQDITEKRAQLNTGMHTFAKLAKSGTFAQVHKGTSNLFALLNMDGANLGAISTAEAFMGEWMVAEIGLEARAKWNALATRWLALSAKEQDAWRSKAWNTQERWKKEATEWDKWASMFDERLSQMNFASKLTNQKFEDFAGSAADMFLRGKKSSKVTEKVTTAVGQRMGINNLASTLKAGLTTFKFGLPDQGESLMRGTARVAPPEVQIAEARAGLNTASMTGPWLVAAAIATGATALVLAQRK